MKIETVLLDQLTPDPKNARKHPQRSIEAIARSLNRFGQQKPIIVAADNVIAAGNGTYLAAKSLGWTTIQIMRTELTAAELLAYKIADNRTTDISTWDYQILSDLLKSLHVEDASLIESAGFLDYEAAPLLASEWTPPAVSNEPIAMPDKKKTAGQSFAVHFTEEQWQTVTLAIEKIREHENDPTISGPRAIELIIADWLS